MCNLMLRKALIVFLFLGVFSVGCSSNDPASNETGQQGGSQSMPLSPMLASLEQDNLSAYLKVYDVNGVVVHESSLSIADGQVQSESFSLTKNASYTFIITFAYTTDDGNTVPIAYVLLTETVTADSVSFTYGSDDFVFSNAATITNDLSPVFDIGAYDLPNLDSDGDGTSNLGEIYGGTDPLDASEAGSDIIVNNIVDGGIVQDTVTIVAMMANTSNTQDIYISSPTGFANQSTNSGIFIATWNVANLAEGSTQTLTFFALDKSGNTYTRTLTVTVDNVPNIDNFLPASSLIQSGQSTDLNWSVSNATSISINQGIGEVMGSSQKAINPVANVTYTITATRGTYSATANTTVAVNNSPVFGSHTTVTAGQDPSSDGGVSLGWTASDVDSDALGYTINLYTGTGCTGSLVSTTTWTGTDAGFENLDALADYSYTVSINDGRGGTAESGCAAFTTGDEGLVAWYRFDEGTGWNISDASGNGVSATLEGTTNNLATIWTANGVAGSGIAFDGTNDFLRVPDQAALDFGTGDFSIGFWFKGNTTDKPLFTKRGSGDTDPGYEIYTNGPLGLRTWLIDDVDAQAVTSNADDFDATTWHHVVVVREGDHYSVYFDGGRDARIASVDDLDLSNALDLIIGGNITASTPTYWNGSIDEVAIYNRALQPTEIQSFCARNDQGNCATGEEPLLQYPYGAGANYQMPSASRLFFAWEDGAIPEGKQIEEYQTCFSTTEADVTDEENCPDSVSTTVPYRYIHQTSIPDSGMTYYWKVRAKYDDDTYSAYSRVWKISLDSNLSAWWRFDESSGSTLSDVRGTADNAGTLHGTNAGTCGMLGVDGDLGCLYFDSVDDYVDVVDHSDLDFGNSDSSIAFWIKTSEITAANHLILAKRDVASVNNAGFEIYIGTPTTLRYWETQTGSVVNAANWTQTAAEIADDAWHQVVVVRDIVGSTTYLSLYWDGELSHFEGFGSVLNINNNEMLSMGASNTGLDKYRGGLDDVMLYKKALSAGEVLANYCAVMAEREENVDDVTMPETCLEF